MVGNTVNCEQVWREISNYVDGDVDVGLRAAMEDHIRTCGRCASVLAGMRNLVQLYGDERMLEIPAGFSGRLQKRLAKNVAVTGKRWLSWSAWLVPLAAMALMVGSLVMMNGHGNYLRSQHAEPGKNIPPDLVVVVSNGAKLFHVPGCEFIHDKASVRSMTAREAIREGYVPCPRCLRQYLKTGLLRSHEEVADNDEAEAEGEQEEVLSVAGH